MIRERTLSHVRPYLRPESVTPSEREPGDADARARAGGNDHPLLEQSLIDIDERRSRADRGGTGRVVDRDRVHPGHVDHDSLAGRVAGVTVPARACDDSDRVPPRPAHGAPDVLRRLAEHDRAGTDAVVARAVGRRRAGVVSAVGRRDDGSLHELRQLDEPLVDGRSPADRHPTGKGYERAGAHSEPSPAGEQLASVESLRPGVRHRVGSVPRSPHLCEFPRSDREPLTNDSTGVVSDTASGQSRLSRRPSLPASRARAGPPLRRAVCAGTCRPA